jgi:catechol 2,3-dioxygenase-like lactoylglutathione lyase family enzyme
MPAVSAHPCLVTNQLAKITDDQPHPIQNAVFNHVAISVTDLEAAADWYQAVFGFRRIRSDRATDRAETPDAPIFKIYPASLKKVKCAWMSCGNGVGFEIFEFQDPKTEDMKKITAEQPFEYTRAGFFHIAVTVADPNATLKLINEKGGATVGEVVEMYGELAAYARDPWGNVIEVLSCSFETLMGNRG